MHHLRTVKDVRNRVRSYGEWVGAFKRKQIPLCKYHHILLHKGKLNIEDIRRISRYTETK